MKNNNVLERELDFSKFMEDAKRRASICPLLVTAPPPSIKEKIMAEEEANYNPNIEYRKRYCNRGFGECIWFGPRRY